MFTDIHPHRRPRHAHAHTRVTNKQVDAALGSDVRFAAKGEAFRFALRFASGFGSQYSYNLYMRAD